MSLPRDANGNIIIPDGVRDRIDDCIARVAGGHIIAKGPERLLLLRRNNNTRWQDVDTLPGVVFGDDSMDIGGPYRNLMLTQLRNAASFQLDPVDMYPLAVPGSYTEGLVRSLRTVQLADGTVRGLPDGYVISMEQAQERGHLQLVSQAGSEGRVIEVLGVLTDGDPAYVGFKPEQPLQIIVCAPSDKTARALVVVRTAEGPPRVEALEAHMKRGMSRPLFSQALMGEMKYFARYRKSGKVEVLRLPQI